MKYIVILLIAIFLSCTVVAYKDNSTVHTTSWYLGSGGLFHAGVSDKNVTLGFNQIIIGNRTGTNFEALFGIFYLDAQDVTNMNLLLPANSTTVYSGNILFYYNITSTLTMKRCELWYGKWNEFQKQQTEMIITADGSNQTFNVRGIPTGEYNWTVKCRDTRNEIHSTANWSFVVTSTSTPGITAPAGGGGDGIAVEEPPAVIKTAKELIDALKPESWLNKLFPDYKLNIKDNGICEPGEDPILINRKDCWPTLLEFWKHAWFIRYVGMITVSAMIFSMVKKVDDDRAE